MTFAWTVDVDRFFSPPIFNFIEFLLTCCSDVGVQFPYLIFSQLFLTIFIGLLTHLPLCTGVYVELFNEASLATLSCFGNVESSFRILTGTSAVFYGAKLSALPSLLNNFVPNFWTPLCELHNFSAWKPIFVSHPP